MTKSTLSLQLAGICIAVVAASNAPLARAGDLLPEASPQFVPKGIYQVDAATMDSAITNTFQALTIPIVQANPTKIVTDYIEGPTTKGANGRVTQSRYKYFVDVFPHLGRTRVSISVLTEAASGIEGSTPIWHDVTSANRGVAEKARGWLYEKIEQSLAGGNISYTSSGSVGASSGHVAERSSEPPEVDDGKTVIPPFDIVGMRVGARPKDIAAIINSRLVDRVNEHVQETRKTLAFTGPNSGNNPISHGEFVEGQWASTTFGGKSGNYGAKKEDYSISYTPEPGAERAAVVNRTVVYRDVADSPLETTVVDELTKKYGEPSVRRDDPVNPQLHLLVWSIGKHVPFSANPPAIGKDSVQDCTGPISSSGSWNGTLFDNFAMRTLQQQIRTCGGAIAFAHWSVRNPNAPKEQRIVSNFSVGIYSPSLVAEVLRNVANLAQETDKASAGEAAQKAKNNKPDL